MKHIGLGGIWLQGVEYYIFLIDEHFFTFGWKNAQRGAFFTWILTTLKAVDTIGNY